MNKVFTTLLPALSRNKFKLVVAISAVVLMVVGAGVYYESVKSNSSAPLGSGSSSLTLYYRDGKTVLWESSKNDGWPHGLAPASAGLAMDELWKKFGDSALSSGEWRVTTTLDPSLQKVAEEKMAAAEAQIKRQRGKNAALIAEDVTNGQVVAVVGKMGGATDVVAQKIEVGSLALPFAYAAVIDANPTVTADTMYDDVRNWLPGYACTDRTATSAGGNCLYNFDHKFLGPVSVRQALGGLRLVPAVNASMQISLDDLHAFNKGLATDGRFACYADEQLSQEVQCYTASVFGDGLFAKPKDMIQAYATLANGGKKLPQASVLKAVQNGKIQYEWRQQSGQQAMKSQTASAITDILTDPNASYLRSKDAFTANGTKVGIIMGYEHGATMVSSVQYTSKYVVGVWGLSDSQGIAGTAETVVLPPASAWMKTAH